MIDAISPAGLAPASTVRAPAAKGATDTTSTDFASMLGDLMAGASNAVKHAEAASIAGIKGQASVQQVVEAVMAAEQTLQGAIAVRDKVVSAYLEISHMQI